MTPNEYITRAIIPTYKTPSDAIGEMGTANTPAGTLISMLKNTGMQPYANETEKNVAWNSFYSQVQQFASSPAGRAPWSPLSTPVFLSFARMYAVHQSRIDAMPGKASDKENRKHPGKGSSAASSTRVPVPEYQRPVEVSDPVMPAESGFRFGPLAVLVAIGVGVWLIKKVK